MENELKVLIAGALNFCQSAFAKFHFATPWSSGLVVVLTAVKNRAVATQELSTVTCNCGCEQLLVTVDEQREAYELSTGTMSKGLHALRPVSEKCVGAGVVSYKSCASRASTKVLPLQFV